VIEVHLDLDGYPVTVLDTAGIRVSNDPVEQEGVERARRRAAEADLVLWVVDAGAEKAEPDIHGFDVNREYKPAIWLVRNKIDLPGSGLPGEANNESELRFVYRFGLSAITGQGMNELMNKVSLYVREYFGGAEAALVSRERQRKLLQETLQALQRASSPQIASREDIVAEELRLAARALGRLTGRVDVEDVLDVIFRDFCIGK
jgi:tRNA modification GTPase